MRPDASLPELGADYFEFLGLERRLNLDSSEMERRFYALSRQLHPDRFVRRGEKERQYSLDATAVLNDAYRTLKDPIARAEYLLKLNGFDIGEQRSSNVPPELLEEVFDLNMALEELRHGDEEARPQLEAAHRRFLEMRDSIDRELALNFAEYDRAGERDVLVQIRAILNRRRYIRNLVGEVEKELEPDVRLSD
ncbi:MAG: Fe-S protein assembly co-chaperone HscB [Bryobacteraceae bacterium]